MNNQLFNSQNILVLKIRKRIDTITNSNLFRPKKVYITQEEADLLKNIHEIDGVRLEVFKPKPIKEDCKFFNSVNHDCNVFTELLCTYKNCKRYNTTIDLDEIEESIQKYTRKVREHGKEKTRDRNESED